MASDQCDVKKFKFQLEVEAVPYNPSTVEKLFGKGASYIPDYPEHTMAAELVGELLKDAICQILELQSDFLVKHPNMDALSPTDAAYWKHLNSKATIYRNIEKTLKHVP